MVLKELLRKNKIKIKALAKDKVIFYNEKDCSKAKDILSKNDFNIEIDTKDKKSLLILKTNRKIKLKEETTSADIGASNEPIAVKNTKKKDNLFRRLVNSKKGV